MAAPTVSVRPATVNGTPVLVVRSPYNPDFAPQAKLLGGRFAKDAEGARWDFDPRDEARVRDLCTSIYGTDGSPATANDTVTIRATLRPGYQDRELYIAGRQVARALGRDSGARLSEGVVLLSGGLTSGGSRANYNLVAQSNTVLEVRDLPRAAVERVIAEAYTVEIVEGAETQSEVEARMGTGEVNSPVEQVWAAIQALPIEAQVEIRNRLLAAL